MNKFKFYFTLFSTLLVLFSCNKDDDDDQDVKPLNDYGVQFKADSTVINTYLKTHYINTAINDYSLNANNADLIKKRTGNEPSVMSLLNSTTYPKLLYKMVKKDNVDYKVYYLQFREGSTTEKPCPYDQVLVTYRGTSLANGTDGTVSATEFENSPVANSFNLGTLFVKGWQEIFPLFGKGVFDETATGNGPNVYTNYGAGIMFLPSGLAYFNQSPQTKIPSYSPLVFSFQLLSSIRIDNDSDGIMTVDEIIRNTDGSFTYTNTDGDNAPDFADLDDDNDGFSTLNEIKKPTPYLGTSLYYPFNPVLDNPLTTDVDESEPKGIPDASGDGTNPSRKRRHLDVDARPPYTVY